MRHLVWLPASPGALLRGRHGNLNVDAGGTGGAGHAAAAGGHRRRRRPARRSPAPVGTGGSRHARAAARPAPAGSAGTGGHGTGGSRPAPAATDRAAAAPAATAPAAGGRGGTTGTGGSGGAGRHRSCETMATRLRDALTARRRCARPARANQCQQLVNSVALVPRLQDVRQRHDDAERDSDSNGQPAAATRCRSSARPSPASCPDDRHLRASRPGRHGGTATGAFTPAPTEALPMRCVLAIARCCWPRRAERSRRRATMAPGGSRGTGGATRQATRAAPAASGGTVARPATRSRPPTRRR